MRGLAALSCALLRTSSKLSSHQTFLRHLTPVYNTTTMSTAASVSPSDAFLEALRSRRTVYALSPETTIPDSKVVEIVQHAVKHTPSSFNSQSSRAVVVFGDQSRKIWDFGIASVERTRGAEAGAGFITKLKTSMRQGYGTVLFFEDQDVIKAMQERAPHFKDYFPQWSQHHTGMVQLVVWTALEKEGLGANLQHLNPHIDEDIQNEFGVPKSWQLIAQMPFGVPIAAPPVKEFKPIEERVRVFGASS